MNIDYNFFYKEDLPVKEDWDFEVELFISAYNKSERVKTVYNKVKAKRKHWLVLPDYKFDQEDWDYLKKNSHFSEQSDSESHFIGQFFSELNIVNLKETNICIDATGFIKPYLMTLIYYLVVIKKRDKVKVIFSEPQEYDKKHKTTFSDGDELVTRAVHGFSGVGHNEQEDDLLVIGAGYDDELIRRAVEKNNSAKQKLQIFGFPSLRADMYQQNILRASKASSVIDRKINFNNDYNHHAPANDPFATAQLLHKLYLTKGKDIKNWYLYPLATKAQMLGFILFYLNECQGKPVSIMYPFSETHSVETSRGTARIWLYTLEFPYRDCT